MGGKIDTVQEILILIACFPLGVIIGCCWAEFWGYPTMSEPVIFQGKELPPKKPGYVWSIRMWPGGRKELRQVPLEEMHHADDAAKRLQNGHCANVWLDDATLVIALLPDEHPQRQDAIRQPDPEKWDLS